MNELSNNLLLINRELSTLTKTHLLFEENTIFQSNESVMLKLRFNVLNVSDTNEKMAAFASERHVLIMLVVLRPMVAWVSIGIWWQKIFLRPQFYVETKGRVRLIFR